MEEVVFAPNWTIVPPASPVVGLLKRPQLGLDLYPVLTALRDWGDKYVADPEGPAMKTTHRECGAPVHVALVCERGHTINGPDDVDRHPGPSARRRTDTAGR
jgi:hypothetical protein